MAALGDDDLYSELCVRLLVMVRAIIVIIVKVLMCFYCFCQADVNILRMGTTEDRQHLQHVFATRDSLRKAAKQLIALLGWSDMDLHTAYKNVERWLGPPEVLCIQAGDSDLNLLLHLGFIQPVMSQSDHMSPCSHAGWECCY